MQEVIDFLSHHVALSIAAIIVLILLLIIEMLRSKQRRYCINPVQATQLINHDNAVVIDIRPTSAFQSGHIINALSMNVNDIKSPSKKIEKMKNKPLLIVCAAGMDSQKIAALLLKHGYNAYALSGGMRRWVDAQMPVVKE